MVNPGTLFCLVIIPKGFAPCRRPPAAGWWLLASGWLAGCWLLAIIKPRYPISEAQDAICEVQEASIEAQEASVEPQ